MPFVVFIVSFVFLSNESASKLFILGRGLVEGYPLSPLLFLIVDKGLSKALHEARESRTFKGIQVGRYLFISHFLFKDDI